MKVKVRTGWDEVDASNQTRRVSDGVEIIEFPKVLLKTIRDSKNQPVNWDGEEITPLPYNMLTQQSLGDKSIADVVEALIGVHLLELGPAATLKFMKWLGLKVLTEPVQIQPALLRIIDTIRRHLLPFEFKNIFYIINIFYNVKPDLSKQKLNEFWVQFQFAKLEDRLGYHFADRAYLLQAFTHASYYKNRITGCYQM
ncbi:unnamed protein product [Gongylonema pulchrum]|uniref:RNase III domain-containing protein n=1 Tax=Gongylonema pulchrum TaxID=637853 RepID=A0A3P7ML82_9BILA|nr:unnamed protein product [Gongylonema pulchrum]